MFDDEDEDNPFVFYDTLLEYYLHIKPAKLDDDEWVEKLHYLAKIREMEAEALKQK